MEDSTSSRSAAKTPTATGSGPRGDSQSRPSSAVSDAHGPYQPPSAPSPSSSSTVAGAAGTGSISVGGPAPPIDPNRQLSKRRRGHGVVTPNACTECRKKRAKCDGQKPCARCKTQKIVECKYEIPVRQSKENLRAEIEQLRSRQRSSDQVISALLRPELWQEVLNRLRGGQSIEAVSDWLGGTLPSGGGAVPSFARPLESVSSGRLAGTSSLGFSSSGPTSMSALSLGTNAGHSPITRQVQTGSTHPPLSASAHLPGLRASEIDQNQNSPWNFSTHSQSGVSTTSESHAGLMNWTPDVSQPSSRVGSWVEGMHHEPGSPEYGQRYRWLDQVLSPLDVPEMKIPAVEWTTITADVNLVQHLLALYFCWEYPTFASLSKEHFLKDFKDGTRRFCSPILVNALLALGCRFSTQPNTRANPSDPTTSGDHFFKESLRLFHLETDHRTLTTIQALGIMSIREASCGRDSESWYYAGQSIRIAIEMGLHMMDGTGDDDEVAVKAATFWGAFALDHAWSLATGSLPQCSCVPHLPPKPAIIDDIEASLWIPYTDDGVPLQRSCEQPSNVRSVYKCFCELSELVHQSLYILHSPGRPLTSRDLLGIYTQYLDWYDRIPEVLRLGHNFTPAVLFAHMYYHFAILLLFRPLIKLRILGSKVLPRDVCSQAADAIQGLLRSYSQLYTLRRTPSFVPYFVLTSAIMHMAIATSPPSTSPTPASGAPQPHLEAHGSPDTGGVGVAAPSSRSDPRVLQSISQGISDLTEMAPCHHFAQQALNILCYLAKKWNLDVDMGHEKTEVTEDFDRLLQPRSNSLNFFAPNVQLEDFMCGWGGGGSSVGGKVVMTAQQTGSDEISQIADNPLFWPFPLQGRPLLPTGRELSDAGFALI
ncbi:hypothetical protein jhhlp_000596 [Lomentospora prolificans]|uniref:Zn(2)-C6 fungal-type domain-containing protein n=1 Tax=Lomentospora prolificans TaxID=41688 RepID=A0A2N3NJ62_9PEZI|nr:hypothetical protein jhhlp_000596 [Lomentospora prolificans]